MKALIQRVLEAQVKVNEEVIGRIGPGLLILHGVAKTDNPKDANRLAERILSYRIFNDDQGRMNHSIKDIEGGILVVSQFTLVADVAKGTRPSFTPAAPPELARELYQQLIDQLSLSGLQIETGQFGASMIVSLHNDGPVTFLLETNSSQDH